MQNRTIIWSFTWCNIEFGFAADSNSLWFFYRFGKVVLFYVCKYAFHVLVPTFKFSSVFGFAVMINMISQMWSGFLLALYYVPDPAMYMTLREEYMNEIWWFSFVYKTHVIGVDSIFLLSYIHILKKIFIKNFVGVQLSGWLSGTYAFLFYHVVVFLGITLSTNHLGDLTLTIAASIFWSLFNYEHKAATLLFTNRHLNTDQVTRLMIAHYVTAWYYVYLVQVHVMYVHDMWDPVSGNSTQQNTNTSLMGWISDALSREGFYTICAYLCGMVWSIKVNFDERRPLSLGFFEHWTETENEDFNFFIVGPHWYFRPHMGLLTVSAQHYEGIFWLVMYYVILALLPLFSNAFNVHKEVGTYKQNMIPMQASRLQLGLFVLFVLSIFYTGNTLPCARFYYDSEEGFFGNSVLRLAYQYVYVYLTVIIHLVDKIELVFNRLTEMARERPENEFDRIIRPVEVDYDLWDEGLEGFDPDLRFELIVYRYIKNIANGKFW